MDADIAHVASTDTPTAPTVLTLLQALYQQRHSGAVILHLRNGVPQVVEFVQSTKVKLTPLSAP
jgi:hypothetical protein